MRNCEYCGQRVERVIRVGDLVQDYASGSVGVVGDVSVTGRSSYVRVLGDRSGISKLWLLENVDLIHGTLRITERL